MAENAPAEDAENQKLMARIAQGDRAAAHLLMQRVLPRVLAIGQRLLSDPVEAEDIAQDTFLRVWKAASGWEAGRAKVVTWISRIAVNLCYDRLRRRREVLTDAPPEQADETVDQESRMMRDQSAGRVADAVALLPDRQRLAIELVHFQEMSNIDAAASMSVSVDALESLLARGRRKLKSLLIADAGELVSSYGPGPAPLTGTRP